MERFITEPCGKTVRQRVPRKPLWWNKGIGNAQQRRKKLVRKWNNLDVKEDKEANSALIDEADRAHKTVQEQKKHVRNLERKAEAKFEKLTTNRLREEGLIEKSKQIKKDQKWKA